MGEEPLRARSFVFEIRTFKKQQKFAASPTSKVHRMRHLTAKNTRYIAHPPYPAVTFGVVTIGIAVKKLFLFSATCNLFSIRHLGLPA
jgi:hypothetical protein